MSEWEQEASYLDNLPVSWLYRRQVRILLEYFRPPRKRFRKDREYVRAPQEPVLNVPKVVSTASGDGQKGQEPVALAPETRPIHW